MRDPLSQSPYRGGPADAESAFRLGAARPSSLTTYSIMSLELTLRNRNVERIPMLRIRSSTAFWGAGAILSSLELRPAGRGGCPSGHDSRGAGRVLRGSLYEQSRKICFLAFSWQYQSNVNVKAKGTRNEHRSIRQFATLGGILDGCPRGPRQPLYNSAMTT
jgi:hypothetical protein